MLQQQQQAGGAVFAAADASHTTYYVTIQPGETGRLISYAVNQVIFEVRVRDMDGKPSYFPDSVRPNTAGWTVATSPSWAKLEQGYPRRLMISRPGQSHTFVLCVGNGCHGPRGQPSGFNSKPPSLAINALEACSGGCPSRGFTRSNGTVLPNVYDMRTRAVCHFTAVATPNPNPMPSGWRYYWTTGIRTYYTDVPKLRIDGNRPLRATTTSHMIRVRADDGKRVGTWSDPIHVWCPIG